MISKLGHDESGAWQVSEDNTQHYKICQRSDCSATILSSDHSGGTATCVAKKVCTTCNKEYGETDTTNGHSFSTDWTTDGTNHWHACLNEGCTGKGSEGKHEGGTANCQDQAVCSTCQTPYGEMDSTTHKSVKTDAAVAATCEATGLTEGKHCEACDTVIKAQEEAPALGHEEGAAATCTTAQTCTRCSHVFNAALGHSYTNYVSNDDAKCEVDGTKTAKCDRCDETSTIPDEGSKLGHSYTQYVSNNNATCQTNATETASCDNGCGGKDTRPIADSMVDHSYGEYFSDNNAACLKDGTKTAKCIWCNNTDTVTDTGSALRHSFTNYVSDGNATCMTDGTKTAKCDNNCGETSTITDAGSALGHSFTNYLPDGNVTCADEGTETAKCDRCDATDTRDATGVQLKPHTFTNYVYNNDATCFADGTKTAHCDVCKTATDKITAEGTKLTHSYSNYVSNNDATCTQDGTKSALCDHNCGTKDTIADTDSKLGHSFTNFVSNGDATCTANGTETAKCDRCEEEKTQEDADSKLDHSFTQYESNNDATCTADGTETAKCDNCDATHTRTQAGSMKDHEMGQWVEVTPAGCTTKGVERQDCENCDHFETKETDALGHSMGAWVTTNAPSCTVDGEERSDCDRCDYFETKVLKSNGHDYHSEVTLEPTCVAKGTETYTCSKCQDTYTKELAETGVHTEATREENRVEATCGADGSYDLVTYCSVCDAVIKTEQKTIPATGEHNYEEEVTKEPTCIALGEKTFTCSGCDASYTEEMAEVEHNVSDSYTTEEGKHFQACLTEGCSYKENVAVCSDAEGDGDHNCDVCDAADVSDHTESEAVKEGYVDATCTSSGYYDSVVYCGECSDELSRTSHTVSQYSHGFGDWEIIANATCTTDGSQKRACTVCGHEETGSIPATGHEVYNNGFCAVCDAYQPAVQNANGIYEIGNAGQLYWFAAQVDSDFENFGSANAILTDNITIPATKSQDATSKIPDWDPIDTFSGTFDGNDKTISGLYIVNTAETFAGMFEQNNGTIRNLTLADVSVISSATNVGGIAGYSSGSISGCSVSGSIKPDDDYDSTNYRGGIAGGNAGIIENCSCSATITGTSNYCGGIVASNRKTVTNCTFSGTVNGEDVGGIAADNQDYGIITDCINEGSVTGTYYAGGIVGNNVGIIENCRNSGSCVVTESTTNKPGAIAAAHYNIGRHGSLAAIRNCYNTADLPLVGTTRCSDLERCPVTIENCHNYSTSGFGIAGYASGTVITNCYYLAESETDSLEGTTFKTEAQFASGEVAYLLNGGSAEGIWKQTIGTDAYPTFAGATVYKNQTGGCTDATFTYAYSNTQEADVINHSWLEATCTEPMTCSACGATDGEKLDHIFTNYVPNNDATCTADGTKTAKCDRCGAATDTVVNEGSMLKHSFLNYVSNNNASCTKNGTETAKCEGCEETDTREDADSKLAHTYSVEQSRIPATCMAEGSVTRKCSGCEETTVETLAIDPNAHVELKYEEAKAPSCAEAGHEAYEYCDSCGYTTYKTVNAHGHKWTDATCTEPKTCLTCGETEGSALNHSFTNYVSDKNASCTADGTKTATCDRCDETDTVTDAGSKLAHTYSVEQSRIPATCKEEGSITWKCVSCDATNVETLEIDPNAHVEIIQVASQAPSCAEAGHEAYEYCTGCDYTTYKTVNANGHEWTAATCTEPKTCLTCGETEGSALNHSFTNYVSDKNASCTADGTKTATCDRCDETDTVTDAGSKLAHTYSVEQSRIPATCKEEGSITLKCSGCEETTVKTLAIDPSNHVELKYEDAKAPSCAEAGHEAYEYCDSCGYTTFQAIATHGHTPGAATEENRVESSCSVAGSYESVVSCSICGTEISRETVKLPLAEHSWIEASYDAPKMCGKCGTTEGSKPQRPAVDMVAPETVVPSVPENAEISKDAAEEAVNSLVSSANNVAQPVTGIESDGNVDSLGAAKQQIKDENENVIAGSSYETSLIITLNAVVVDQEGSNVVAKKVTFDVSPMLYAINELGIKVGETKITEFDEPITFHLPVDKNSTAAFARVWHMDTEDLGLHKIQTDAAGNRFVEVKAKNFSQFSLVLEEECTDHNFVDGKCTICGAEESKGSIRDSARTISLDGVIYINQYVTIHDVDDLDSTYIETHGGLLIWNSPINEADAVYTHSAVDINPGMIKNVYQGVTEYMARTDGIPAKKYADEVYIRAYLELPDGSYIYGPLVEYSVQDYCEDKIANYPSDKLKNLCASLLHFGAAAQKFFKYNSDDLANANILNEWPVYAFDPAGMEIPGTIDTSIAPSEYVKDNGQTISLDGAIVANFYYKVTTINVQKVELMLWNNVTGQLTVENVTSTKEMKLTNGEYFAQSDEIPSKYYGKIFYACAKVTDTNGNVYYSNVIGYNPDTYAKTHIDRNQNAELIELVKRMVVYSEFAKSYFNVS